MNQVPLRERIALMLNEQGLKKVDFARTLGVSANYVSLLASGKKQNISVPLARLIESAYGYRAGWVLTGEDPVRGSDALRDLQENTVEQIKQMGKGELRAVAAYIKMLETQEAAPVKTNPAVADNPANLQPTFTQRLQTLSEAERRVYDLYAKGCNVRQISDALGISANTIKTHSRHIYKKLGVNSRSELLDWKGGGEE